MANRLAKHGSEAGYRQELQTNSVCERCRNGHRVFDSQYSKTNKAKGLKYGRYDVLDHLYNPEPGKAMPRGRTVPRQRVSEPSDTARPRPASEPRTAPTASTADDSEGPDFTVTVEPSGPSLSDRVSEGLKRLIIPGSNEYVNDNDIPDYLHESEPDPEPAEEWEGPEGDEYVINKAGMVLIEENLGTYLSVVGITLEMIDPYCGPILADNFENIVGRWTKVIAKYPRAAKLFMSKEGGTIMSWIGALQATWPVLLAIYDHHLAKNVKVDNLGRAYRVTNPEQSPNGETKQDATTPPFQFTVELEVLPWRKSSSTTRS